MATGPRTPRGCRRLRRLHPKGPLIAERSRRVRLPERVGHDGLAAAVVVFALFPEAEPSQDRLQVVAHAHAFRQRLEAFRLAPAEHHVVALQAVAQDLHDRVDVLRPLLLAEPLQAPVSGIVLVGLALLVGHVGQLHGGEHPFHHEGGAEAGAEAEKQHAAAVVAAEGLHGRVVHDPHRLPEGLLVVEALPAATEVRGVPRGAAVHDRTRVAHRDHVVGPALGRLLHLCHHACGGHLTTRGDLHRLALAAGHAHLQVAAADVDDEDSHGPPEGSGPEIITFPEM